MRLPPFQYLEPTNVEEALSMIGLHKEAVKIMAGGTDLLNRMKLRLIEPAFVMNIGKIRDMDGIDSRRHRNRHRRQYTAKRYSRCAARQQEIQGDRGGRLPGGITDDHQHGDGRRQHPPEHAMHVL